MICFYHNDLDGHCAGAIVKLRYPDCKMVEINYGDYFTWDQVKGQDVFMVDFSLQPFKRMLKLRDAAGTLTWIDHHKSAIAEIGREQFLGRQEEGLSGCELTWQYLNPDKEMPKAVRLLGRYDVWDHSDPETIPFQHGAKLHETRPEKNIRLWESWFAEFPKDVLERGRLQYEHIMRSNKKTCDQLAFETQLDGLDCIAMNRIANSQVFDSVWDPNKYHMMVAFQFKKTFWTVSLYSDRNDIDVSLVAKAHGGGGHKGAAGFQCVELPFKLPKK